MSININNLSDAELVAACELYMERLITYAQARGHEKDIFLSVTCEFTKYNNEYTISHNVNAGNRYESKDTQKSSSMFKSFDVVYPRIKEDEAIKPITRTLALPAPEPVVYDEFEPVDDAVPF